MILFLLAYLGGVLTIVSPCILPVLPFVFARAGQPFVRTWPSPPRTLSTAIDAADMVAYRFFPRADAAQDKIWDDTVEKWGEAQAVTYITGLHAHLRRLCKDRMLWRRLPQKLIALRHRRLSSPHDFCIENIKAG